MMIPIDKFLDCSPSPLVTPEVWRGHPKCGVEHAMPVPKEASACLEDQTSTIHCSWL
jgi:hypothetical protein